MHADTTYGVTRQFDNSYGSFELVLSSVLLALGGWWIDTSVGTTPLFTVVGAILGAVGATIKIVVAYRLAMAEQAAMRPSVGGVARRGALAAGDASGSAT